MVKLLREPGQSGCLPSALPFQLRVCRQFRSHPKRTCPSRGSDGIPLFGESSLTEHLLGGDLRQPHQQKQLPFPGFQGGNWGFFPPLLPLYPPKHTHCFVSVLHPLCMLGGREVWFQTFFLSNCLFIQSVTELSRPSLKGQKAVKSFCVLVFPISHGSPNIVWGPALGLRKQD